MLFLFAFPHEKVKSRHTNLIWSLAFPLHSFVSFLLWAVVFLPLSLLAKFSGCMVRGVWFCFVYCSSWVAWMHLGLWTIVTLPSKCHWLSKLYNSNKQFAAVREMSLIQVHESGRKRRDNNLLQVAVCANIYPADYTFIQFLYKGPCVKRLFT